MTTKFFRAAKHLLYLGIFAWTLLKWKNVNELFSSTLRQDTVAESTAPGGLLTSPSLRD